MMRRKNLILVLWPILLMTNFRKSATETSGNLDFDQISLKKDLSSRKWQTVLEESSCQSEISLEDDQMIILNSDSQFMSCNQRIRAVKETSIISLYSLRLELKGSCQMESVTIVTENTEVLLCCKNKVPIISGPYIEIAYLRKFEDIYGSYTFIILARETVNRYIVPGASPDFTGSEECGIPEVDVTARIVGGERVQEASLYPFIARLIIDEGGEKYDCGASLISSQHALTAAHCVQAKDQLHIMVSLGKVNISADEDGSIEVAADEIFIHPKYDAIKLVNDIAIIKLSSEIPFSSNIKPICLPSSQESRPEPGDSVIVIGWGLQDYYDYEGSEWLNMAVLNTWSNEKCAKAWNKHGFDMNGPNTEICAYEDGKDTCLGDSGGPLFMKIGNRYVIMGLTSFGYKCAEKDLPGVYTRVANHLPWIWGFLKHSCEKKNPSPHK